MADCLDELWAVHWESLLAAHSAYCSAAMMVYWTVAMTASTRADEKECLTAARSVKQKVDRKVNCWAESTGGPLAGWKEQPLAALWVAH